MDELLSLFEDDESIEEGVTDESSQATKNQCNSVAVITKPVKRTTVENVVCPDNSMDELLNLLEDDESIKEGATDDSFKATKKKSNSVSVTTKSVKRTTVENVVSPDSSMQRTNNISISVDERIGIRMINRKISGTDLLGLMCENPYFAPAQLSAMSLKDINTQILLDPAAIIDIANVFGRTQLLAVGIVFSNSGSRISSSGSAFSVIQIGSNLQTGPTVSIMLFGNCYSAHCRGITPGKVIAVFNPRLLPKNSNEKSKQYKGKVDYTTISFTVNDTDQIKIVADAQDYSICKATVSAKNENGRWISNGKGCCQHVDKRISEYCTLHRRQQQNASTTKNSLEKLKQESKQFLYPQMKNSIMSSNPPKPMTISQQLASQHNLKIIHRSNVPTSNSLLVPNQRTNHNLGAVNISTNSIAAPKAIPDSNRNHVQQLSGQPKRMLPNNYNTGKVSHNNNQFLDLRTKRLPPIQTNHNVKIGKTVKNSNLISICPIKNSIANTQEWTRKRRASVAVNTDTNGFDGSVPIPRRAKLFSGGTSQTAGTSQSMRQQHNNLLLQQREIEMTRKRSQEAINKQKMLAEQIKLCKAKGIAVMNNGTNIRPKKNILNSTSSSNNNTIRQKVVEVNKENLLYGSLTNIDLSAIANANSRFANEVDAEEQARSRKVITDLEIEETKKQQIQNNKNKKSNNNQQGGGGCHIETKYICKTCNRYYKSNPIQCIKLKHNVITDRKINEMKSIVEQRTILNKQSIENGGLKIGSGLEWSYSYK